MPLPSEAQRMMLAHNLKLLKNWGPHFCEPQHFINLMTLPIVEIWVIDYLNEIRFGRRFWLSPD